MLKCIFNICKFKQILTILLILLLFPTKLIATDKLLNAEEFGSLVILDDSYKIKVRNALRKTFGVNEPSTIVPLSGGFSQTVYKLSIKNKYYILRISDASLADRKRESQCMRIAANIGVAPKFYYINIKDGIFIIDYIESKQLSKDNREDPNLYKELAILLKKFHLAAGFPKNISIIKRIEKITKKPTYVTSAISEIAIKNIELLEPLLKKHFKMSSSHNDLQPNNILFDGKRFWVIDWEQAALQDPYYDLATISNFFIPNQEKLEDLYLQTYFNGTPNKKQLAHYIIMKQISLAYYGLLLMNNMKNTNLNPISEAEIQALPSLKDFYATTNLYDIKDLTKHLQKFGATMLKEAVKNMDSEKFKNAVNIISKSSRE